MLRVKKIARKTVTGHTSFRNISEDNTAPHLNSSTNVMSAERVVTVVPVDANERILQPTSSFLSEKFHTMYHGDVKELLQIPSFPYSKKTWNEMKTSSYVVGVDKTDLRLLLKKGTPGRDCLHLFVKYEEKNKDNSEALKFQNEFKLFELYFQRLNFDVFGQRFQPEVEHIETCINRFLEIWSNWNLNDPFNQYPLSRKYDPKMAATNQTYFTTFALDVLNRINCFNKCAYDTIVDAIVNDWWKSSLEKDYRPTNEEHRLNYLWIKSEQKKKLEYLDSLGLPKFKSYAMYVNGIDKNLQFILNDGTPNSEVLHLYKEQTDPDFNIYELLLHRVNHCTGNMVSIDSNMVHELMGAIGNEYARLKDFEWSDPFLQSPKDFNPKMAAKDNLYLEEFQNDSMERIEACNYHAYHVIQDFLAIQNQIFVN